MIASTARGLGECDIRLPRGPLRTIDVCPVAKPFGDPSLMPWESCSVTTDCRTQLGCPLRSWVRRRMSPHPPTPFHISPMNQSPARDVPKIAHRFIGGTPGSSVGRQGRPDHHPPIHRWAARDAPSIPNPTKSRQGRPDNSPPIHRWDVRDARPPSTDSSVGPGSSVGPDSSVGRQERTVHPRPNEVPSGTPRQ